MNINFHRSTQTYILSVSFYPSFYQFFIPCRDMQISQFYQPETAVISWSMFVDLICSHKSTTPPPKFIFKNILENIPFAEITVRNQSKYKFNMIFYFTGTLSSCDSPLILWWSSADFYFKSPLAQMHEISLSWLQFKTTTDTEFSSSGLYMQLQSCKQVLPPKNALFYNLDQFSITERPKILKRQLMFSKTCDSNQATDWKLWFLENSI